MTAIILQARIDSKRLAGKALLPLGGKPIVFRVMEALNNVPANIRILACPKDSVSSFAPLAQECGFQLFCGPKEDVLARFCACLRKFNISRIIRATADNPFVFTDAAAAINAQGLALNADYAAYTALPHGAGVESVSAAALLRAEAETAAPYDREHVCPYLYNNGNLFNLHRPLAPLRWQPAQIRLTIDTQEDYEKAKELYSALKENLYKYYGHTIIKTWKKVF